MLIGTTTAPPTTTASAPTASALLGFMVFTAGGFTVFAGYGLLVGSR
jgi:hypothetical protein